MLGTRLHISSSGSSRKWNPVKLFKSKCKYCVFVNQSDKKRVIGKSRFRAKAIKDININPSPNPPNITSINKR